MLAIIYLALMIAVGDAIGRRFVPFVSVAHRWASAFLIGLLVSTWFTYLAALASSGSATPMFSGNLAFFIAAAGILYLTYRGRLRERKAGIDLTETEFTRVDWAIAGIFLLFASWMMFRTFTMTGDDISIGHHQFPDFGSTLSIMQSFALGHNFPTEYPHFSGDRIRYHFLFYFQAGNLEYLGLSPAWANNIISILSLTSLLVMVMTLGSVVFRSRAAGRIGAALFFFHGSLSFIPFLIDAGSLAGVFDKLAEMKMYLNSGLPYRGEDWGVWSQNVFLNQRHFSSSIAIFVFVLVFLFIRFREKLEAAPATVTASESSEPETASFESAESGEGTVEPADADEDRPADIEAEDIDEAPVPDTDIVGSPETGSAEAAENVEEEDQEELSDHDNADGSEDQEPIETEVPSRNVERPPTALTPYVPYILCGILLGLLPMWNGPVYLSAAIVLGMVLLLFPFRKELIVLGITAAVLGLPQVLFLTMGLRPAGYSMFRWGFVIDNAGVFDVLYYIFFTFGFKWVLIAVALYFASGMQRRLLLAVSILFPLTFCFRFSEEVLANHKFLNVWLVVANVFVGFALVKLWSLRPGGSFVPTRLAAVALTVLITLGGLIDLVPVWNSHFIHMKYKDDPLVEWVKENTEPSSIFLSHRYINHQILLAGRRLFYGDPYYAWSAGYDTPARERLAKELLETKDAAELHRKLKENNIGYIAIDDMVRTSRTFVQDHNEEVIARHFPLVFPNESRVHANIKIYKVPDSISVQPGSAPAPGVTPDPAQGGLATRGLFNGPRGLATDSKGNVYVADTGNSRVQKFDPDGKLVSTLGDVGKGAGQMTEPNGVAIDDAGRIYVTDVGSHKLMRFSADGQFEKEWSGPTGAGNFYGPRDLVIAPDGSVYIIDQGGTRIARLDPGKDEFTTWGSSGSGEGQFNEPTGIAIGGKMVFVADANNDRVQIFDLKGAFQSVIAVPGWEKASRNYADVAYDESTQTLYVTNGRANQLLAFRVEGTVATPLQPPGGLTLDNPSALVIAGKGADRYLLILNTGSGNIVKVPIGEKAKK